MKTLLKTVAVLSAIALPGAGNAADLPVRAPVAPAAAALNWTGWHVGFHTGAGWGDKSWADRLVQDNVSYPTSGWVTGVQLGYDLQSGPVVLGAEAEWSWTNIEGNGAPANLLVSGAPGQLRSELNWLASVGGRVGLVADKALIYAKVAAVWVDEEHTLTPSSQAVRPQTVGDARAGFLLGAGVEYWIAPILSAKLEYNYDDFGTKAYSFSAIPGQVDANERQRLHVFKLGLNYRFDFGR